MINLEIGELYGLRNEKELLETIRTLQEIGMTDEQINKILENSKRGDEFGSKETNTKASKAFGGYEPRSSVESTEC